MNSDCRSTAVVLIIVTLCGCAIAQYQVLLRDVQVLTLRQGLMTTGRRSSPVPQLKCVGGTAGCDGFVPQAVQCYNRGSDGVDVQWECKTDMDNAFRFGRTDVTCEGYSYPDDPYILKGSCGLEYTIDLTKEGHDSQRNSQKTHGGYYSKPNAESKSWGGAVVFIMVIVCYIVYKQCLATPRPANDPTAHPHDRQSFEPPPPYTPRHDDNSSPPPPGFKPEHTRGAGPTYGASGGTYGSGASYRGGSSSSTSYGQQYDSGSTTYTVPPQTEQAAGGNTGGGFWTGAAAGSLLGYLFGSSNSRGGEGYYNQPHYPTGGFGGRRGYNSGWGSSDNSGWFSTGSGTTGGSFFSGGSSGGSSSSSSSGTRTASGYGGTSRR